MKTQYRSLPSSQLSTACHSPHVTTTPHVVSCRRKGAGAVSTIGWDYSTRNFPRQRFGGALAGRGRGRQHVALSSPRGSATMMCRRAVITGARRKVVFSNTFQSSKKMVHQASVDALSSTDEATAQRVVFHGMHHVGLLCENLEKSLAFYQDILGLQLNPDRPDDKLPYRGAWLWIGPEMIHLMELPNPDPMDGRPEHGGRDRHFCVGVKDIGPLEARLKEAGVEYTKSMSGRAAIFFRDPDMNCLECVELHESWRA